MPGTESQVEKTWGELTSFWKEWAMEWGDKLSWEGEMEGLCSKELNNLDSDRAYEYLQYVVHQRDLEWIVRYIPKHMPDMAQWLFSKPKADQNLMPMPPQPFFGSPLSAKIIVVLNNPGFEDRFYLEKKQSAIKAAKSHTERLKGEMDKGAEEYAPWSVVSDGWVDGFRYYVDFYNDNKDVSTESVKYLSGYLDLPREEIFHMDLCAYQSKSGSDRYIRNIWKENEKNIWMPSQQACLNMLGSILNDTEERFIIFRTRREGLCRAIMKYLKEVSLVKENRYFDRVLFMKNGRVRALTIGTLGVDWMEAREFESINAKIGIKNLLNIE